MRLAVEGTGYQSAVEACVSANLLAVDACRSLSTRLDGYAGMAGDDSAAADFASSYDEAAAGAVAVLGELTFGFAALGHLTDASLRNLSWADTVSGPPTLADRSIGVRPATPPSVLGTDSSSLPGWANVVLDLLEGVFWPDADTDRLRSAGATWRAAATSVGLLAAHCASAVAALGDEVSPEVPLAIAATDELRSRTEALADQYVAIGAACETYADHVDAKRAELLDLLHELAVELSLGVIVTGAIDFFTAGAATGPAGAAGAARIAAASDKAGGILASLRALTSGTAITLRPVATTLADTRAYLSRLAAARRMYVTERGSIDFGAYLDWLKRFEGARGGHALERHVGKSAEWLYERVLSHPTAKFASSFYNEDVAEQSVATVLQRYSGRIESWLAGGLRQLELEDRLAQSVGISVDRSGNILESLGVRIILVRDPSTAEGFIVKTAYPKP